MLSGTLEVETSDGRKYRCGGGGVFLADDVGSRGHRTRTIDGPGTVSASAAGSRVWLLIATTTAGSTRDRTKTGVRT